jgi:transposase
VITIPRSVRIFIGSTPIDMRKSIDGLMAIVQEEVDQDAYSGHLFVFVSRRCDRVKILTWDKGGFVSSTSGWSAASSSYRTWTRPT